MNKKTIAEFFDNCAPWWDADMIRDEDVITTIVTGAGIREGVHVLDVACGTGVLFPDYLRRGVASVTGIDISREMAKLAAEKFPQVKVICGDVEETEFDRQFDCVMVYNAFPHFPDPEKLIARLAQLVKPGGRLSVAHGMSREALTSHHAGRATNVSIDLLHEQELAAIFDQWFDVDVVISTDRMYQVAGVRRTGEGHTHHHHGHSHTHIHDTGDTPIDEQLALMKYMVQHNEAHAEELVQLAMELDAAGKHSAYARIMDAVANYDVGNTTLAAVLDDLTQ